MKTPAAVVLRGFGAAFGGRPVLADIDLEMPVPGMAVLVGPAGSGKSTLVRTLAGVNAAHPDFSCWGAAEIGGEPLASSATSRVALVTQHSRFFVSSVRENLASALPNRNRLPRYAQTELARGMLRDSGLLSLMSHLDTEVVRLPKRVQRMLAIVRATAQEPDVLLVDEPSAGLDDHASIDILAFLRMQANIRAVVFVTHNHRHARVAGGFTHLLAGGRIVETSPTHEFFRMPRTEHGRRFLATGGCALPSPGASDADLDEEAPRPPPLSTDIRAAAARSDAGPRGFFWVVPGRLGGLPRPGIVAELEQDLDGLVRLRVDTLVTLEETQTVDPIALARHGIAHVHVPIPDMGAPSLPQAEKTCAVVAARMEAGAVVAYHCRAGLGRTGTLLASQLVWSGDTAVRAIERVRQINPRCIQSDEQVAFLCAFEERMRPSFPSTIPPEVVTQTRKREPNVP